MVKTYDSEFISEMVDSEYMVKVSVEYSGSMRKEVAYSTPFGDNYKWEFDFVVESVTYDIFKNGLVQTVVATHLFNSNAAFANEVNEEISREFEKFI